MDSCGLSISAAALSSQIKKENYFKTLFVQLKNKTILLKLWMGVDAKQNQKILIEKCWQCYDVLKILQHLLSIKSLYDANSHDYVQNKLVKIKNFGAAFRQH